MVQLTAQLIVQKIASTGAAFQVYERLYNRHICGLAATVHHSRQGDWVQLLWLKAA